MTKEVQLDVQFEGTGPDPWGNTRAGICARTTIYRKDFGANWNAILETGGVLVGDSLKIELNVSAIKRKTDQDTPETLSDASAEAEAKTDGQSWLLTARLRSAHVGLRYPRLPSWRGRRPDSRLSPSADRWIA